MSVMTKEMIFVGANGVIVKTISKTGTLFAKKGLGKIKKSVTKKNAQHDVMTVAIISKMKDG